MIFISCPPIYHLPGTWTRCNALIPHYNSNSTLIFAISTSVIVLTLTAFGVYRTFFANKNLTDPWDDHDD